MKNDRRFLSGSDEELIQALESLLQQKAPDQDAVHAILDELDRRSNASAFDLERGWSDVQARSRASKLEPREASRWKAWLRSAACFLLEGSTRTAASNTFYRSMNVRRKPVPR